MRFFLNLKGIQGPVAEKPYVGWIEVYSFSWGREPPFAGGGQGVARAPVSTNDLTVILKSGIHTVPMLSAGADGRGIPEATLQLTHAGGKTGQFRSFATYTMTYVLVAAYEFAAAPPLKSGKKNEPKLDACTLSFDEVKVLFA